MSLDRNKKYAPGIALAENLIKELQYNTTIYLLYNHKCQNYKYTFFYLLIQCYFQELIRILIDLSQLVIVTAQQQALQYSISRKALWPGKKTRKKQNKRKQINLLNILRVAAPRRLWESVLNHSTRLQRVEVRPY